MAAPKGVRPDEMIEVDGVLYRPEHKPNEGEEGPALNTRAARRNVGGSGSTEGTAPVADAAPGTVTSGGNRRRAASTTTPTE